MVEWAELQDFIDTQRGVDKTISLVDYLALVRRTLRPEVAGTLPSEQNEVDQLSDAVADEDLFRGYSGNATSLLLHDDGFSGGKDPFLMAVPFGV